MVVVFKLNVCTCFLVPGHNKFDISQYLFVINQNNYSSNKTVADLELRVTLKSNFRSNPIKNKYV